jgi:hypothetical protein
VLRVHYEVSSGDVARIPRDGPVLVRYLRKAI